MQKAFLFKKDRYTNTRGITCTRMRLSPGNQLEKGVTWPCDSASALHHHITPPGTTSPHHLSILWPPWISAFWHKGIPICVGPSTGCLVNISNKNIPGPYTWLYAVIYSSLVVFMFARFTSPTRGCLLKAEGRICASLVSPQIHHNDGHENKCPQNIYLWTKSLVLCKINKHPQGTPTHTNKSQVTSTAKKAHSKVKNSLVNLKATIS